MKTWVQSLTDACLNVVQTNVIYNHIHHDEYANMLFKWSQKKLLTKLKKEKT
jgi:hypothetical protein